MKLKNVVFVVPITLVMCCFEGCQKDELLYSCDSEINDWVIENKTVYANVPRAEMATFSYDKQLGLFRSFSPEQRVRLYQEKYRYLMGLESLSVPEKEQIHKIYALLLPDIYVSKENRRKFNEFADKWTEESIMLFGWSLKDVFVYTHTWLTSEEVVVMMNSLPRLKSTQAEDNCNCHYTIACPGFGFDWSCVTGGCKLKDGGCGIFGTTDCDGICKHD
jgi:hypothetical protein